MGLDACAMLRMGETCWKFKPCAQLAEILPPTDFVAGCWLASAINCRAREFPFKGVLKAAESLPMTPRLAAALLRLRPCITDFLGDGEARNLHARINNMLSGRVTDTSLEAQGAWSQIVFKRSRNLRIGANGSASSCTRWNPDPARLQRSGARLWRPRAIRRMR
jgi:hypothetical protein